MLRIEFEGNAEEILHDMQLLLGARTLTQKKAPEKAEPETVKVVKTASPVAEAPKKPAKKEPAKSPEEHTTPEQLTKLRQVAVAFLRKDPKNHEILKKWLSVHGFERITKITPDKVDTFLAEFENA